MEMEARGLKGRGVEKGYVGGSKRAEKGKTKEMETCGARGRVSCKRDKKNEMEERGRRGGKW